MVLIYVTYCKSLNFASDVHVYSANVPYDNVYKLSNSVRHKRQ